MNHAAEMNFPNFYDKSTGEVVKDAAGAVEIGEALFFRAEFARV